ncbi:hypothetical protein TCAL_12196 [Tigriopus californicus]|uniref:Alpha-mannosidase n=1 Tax=Tigriopus californicus TaxID=6832 RepID=A0A553PPL8_TIGCA|nr:lysosomal alpha-mannosidase-like [Tigriopus californicus]TRY79620.1 hypothetical protein TCAL_12196 [Tigriopus californicus]|eukprot:TCALIF_12196-PA protein Name:"Similar to MAN2B1 Lysosomal alpha-mannosidase (Macaca fascicularis)" AED:0.04 eAED:0.04 QI:0/0/0/0.66/1/1/3/0/1022
MMRYQVLFSGVLAIILGCQGYPQPEKAGSCGYESCNPIKPGLINVHLVPHSHDDVGWLKTVDQYFTGTNRANWEWENQKPGVQYVIDSVVKELTFAPEKKYIQVETAFFWRWWLEQDDQMKNMTRSLVENGQLEFVSGGWSMNDEGAAHYTAIIDQMSLGVRHLHDVLGDCARPRVAWQIDPFGHSKEQANIFALMGFDGYFFGRLDWRDKDKRLADKSMEMIWQAQSSTGEDSDIFTGINYNGYSPPATFCWDIYCDDEPMMDNPRLKDYNAPRRAQEFIQSVREQADHYRTKNVKIEMGMDFHYQSAISWYRNMDKLIKFVNNEDPEINVIYSTPSCYLKALHDEQLEWPIKKDDFFPYASDPHAYWTGYFSSRSSSKFQMRQANQILQAAKQMTSVAYNKDVANLSPLEDATELIAKSVAICQHHDAITGTEKQYVANDYHDRLSEGVDGFMRQSIAQNGFTYCPLRNVTQCPITETSSKFVINVYNPLARAQSRFVRVPVKSEEWVVTTETGEEIPCQTVPIPEPVLNMPGQKTKALFELVFKADNIPPLGGSFFQATEGVGKSSSRSSKRILKEKDILEFDNGLFTTVISQGKTQLKVEEELIYTFNEKYLWYTGHRGDNSNFDKRASGAYIFRPDGEQAEELALTGEPIAYEGELVIEIHTTYETWASHVRRIYQGEPRFDYENEWLVGPVPIEDQVGKEVIYRITVDEIENAGEFVTDSNGRQMMARKRNFRPTFDINMTEPVSQNYYPVNSRIGMSTKEGKHGLVILNDRSQAGGSIHENELELLLHRRLMDDDDFGVNETLSEEAFEVGLVVRGKNYLLFNHEDSNSNVRHRKLGLEIFGTPLMFFKDGDLNAADVAKQRELFPNLDVSLPQNIHLLTLEPFDLPLGPVSDGKTLLVRLEHIFDQEEDTELSQPQAVSLPELLASFGVIEAVEELTLGGNEPWAVAQARRLRWTAEDNTQQEQVPQRDHKDDSSAFTYELKPMSIRTFKVTLKGETSLETTTVFFQEPSRGIV